MQEYIIELSNYCITILMAFYTLECFVVFRYRVESRRKGIYIRQRILIFLIQFICFLNLTLVSGKLDYMFFYAFVQVLFIFIMFFLGTVYEKMNKLLINNMCMLLGIGLCIVSRLSFQKALKQYVIIIISLIIVSFIPYLLERITFLKKITWVYGAVGFLLLSCVLILGETTLGSKISFSIGGLSFQPSEFVKIIFVFFLAGALWEDVSLKRIIITTLIAGLHVIILVASRDLGSALIFFICFLFVVFVATHNYLYLLIGAGGGSLAAVVAYHIFSHVKVRVLAWQDPWTYIDNQGYQITQSLFAISGGSWFGMGLLKGDPKAIPFVEADFIFSPICEELGVIFAICLILVCVSCFIVMIDISLKAKDKFYQLIIYGLAITYIFQIFLTVGGGIKFIPLTGVTLPFISYGGSSVLTTMIMFYLIQGIYIMIQKEGEKRFVQKRKVRQDIEPKQSKQPEDKKQPQDKKQLENKQEP